MTQVIVRSLDLQCMVLRFGEASRLLDNRRQ
jgi:hypothetical protein